MARNTWQNEVKIRIAAQDDGSPVFDAFSRKLGGLKKTLNELGGVLGSLGIGLSLAGLTATLKSVADDLDRVSKASQKVGLSVEGLSALEYAAGQSGVEVASLESNLQRLARAAVEASQGGKEQAETFAALGVSVTDSNGKLKATDTLLLELAEAFSQFADGPEKTALAMRVFGKAGGDMIPMLNAGRDGIAGLMDEARQLGIVMDTEAAQAAERFNDNLDRLQKSMRGLAIAAGQDMLPALTEITDAMVEAAKEGGILKAVWVGLGGVASQVINGTELGQLRDRANELEKVVAQMRGVVEKGAAPIPFSPFEIKFNDATLSKYKANLAKAETELKAAQDRIAAILNPPKKEKDSAPDLAPSPLIEAKREELEDLKTVTKAQEQVLRDADRDLSASLADRKSVATEFKKLFDEITKPTPTSDDPLRGLDLSYALTQAEAAKASGNLDEALAKAREAADLIRKAKEQGAGFSTEELGYYARRAGQVADAIMVTRQTEAEANQNAAKTSLEQLIATSKGLEKLPVGIDTSFAEGAIKSFHAAMQQYLQQNPLTVSVMAATPQVSAVADAGSFAEVLRREALKRGG